MIRKAGDVIVYRCSKCRKDTITVLVDEGLVPDIIACRASGSILHCNGSASLWSANVLKKHSARWEWFSPVRVDSVTSTENRAVEFAMRLLQIRTRRADSAGITAGGEGG